MAILAAVVAVAVVATGGAALIAIGAIAGAAGAAYGAVLGSLLCGQMVAKVREWTKSKDNFKINGIPTITGDHQMLCPLFGDKITFAPEIKTWGQALAKGGTNLIGRIMEGMMAGALIGTGGALISGASSAFVGGGMRGLGQAGLNLLKTAPSNIMSNFGQGIFSGTGFKIIDGATNWLNTYGDTGQANKGDFTEGLKESAFGDAKALKNVLTGNGKMEDYLAAAMLLIPGGKGKHPKNEPNTKHVTEPNLKDEPHLKEGGEHSEHKSDNTGKKEDNDENSTKPKHHTPENNTKKGKDGEAFANAGDAKIEHKEKILSLEGTEVLAAKTGLNTRFIKTAEGVTTDLQPTLNRIASGVRFPHRNDGSIFKNFAPKGQTNPLLPLQPQGYYREFVHPTPGGAGPGAMRIVSGQGGEMWFTPDHYKSFIPIR